MHCDAPRRAHRQGLSLPGTAGKQGRGRDDGLASPVNTKAGRTSLPVSAVLHSYRLRARQAYPYDLLHAELV